MAHKIALDFSLKLVKPSGMATEYFENYLYDISEIAEAVADVASADATDLPSVITLANETKARFNELLANLRTSGKLDE